MFACLAVRLGERGVAWLTCQDVRREAGAPAAMPPRYSQRRDRCLAGGSKRLAYSAFIGPSQCAGGSWLLCCHACKPQPEEGPHCQGTLYSMCVPAASHAAVCAPAGTLKGSAGIMCRL